MEAAIALSKVFTEAGVQHSFPGDFTMELLPYIDYDESLIPSSDDVGKLQRLFTQNGSPFQVLPFNESGIPEIELLFKNFINSENETVVTFSGKETHRPPCLTFPNCCRHEQCKGRLCIKLLQGKQKFSEYSNADFRVSL